MSYRNLTIKDIAKMAGVSAGTVDRVLHNRGNVSEAKQHKVDIVLEQINYKPNLIAKTLKKNRNYKVSVLLPDPDHDQYWSKAVSGLNAAAEEFGSFGITLDIVYFESENARHFSEIANKVCQSKPDGVLIAPMFYAESLKFFKKCHTENIPYITFNTAVKQSNPISFIGQDLYQSGRLAGNIILISQKFTGKIILLHIDESPDNAPHMLEKQRGFSDYLQENKYDMELLEIIKIPHDKIPYIDQFLERRIKPSTPISGIYISTSKAYTVSAFFNKHFKDISIVGYDLIDENIEQLKNGTITFLINQNPYQLAYQGILRFTDYLVFGKKIIPKELLPLHLVAKENLESVKNQTL